MAAFLPAFFSPFRHRPAPISPPVRPANCVNGKATAAFANFAAAAPKQQRQQKEGRQQQQQHWLQQQKQRILHKCIYIYLSDGRALYCSYVLDGPAKWRIGKKSLKQNQQRSSQHSRRYFSLENLEYTFLINMRKASLQLVLKIVEKAWKINARNASAVA